jgi:hypothetical protein
VADSSEHNNEHTSSITGGEFLDYQPLKKGSTP